MQVIQCHATFMARALDGLMLCRLPLLRPLLALQQGALDFAARVNVAWDSLETNQVRELRLVWLGQLLLLLLLLICSHADIICVYSLM